MKSVFILLSVIMFFSCSPSTVKMESVSFKEQWDCIRVLKNPHKGWYHHLLDNGIQKYAICNDSIFASFPGMDHLYLRLAWSYLEPEEGKYNWHYIDDVVSKYVPLGYHIAFRITNKETGTVPGSVAQELNGVQYATPIWVQKAGAKGVVAKNEDILSWVPKWDDPVYLEKLNNFHRAFAARYDGQPWLRYVDIGSIGEWGEGHTFFSTKIPPTVSEVKANMDIFIRNYLKSQLVCTDDLLYFEKSASDVKALYNYAISNGITLRDDSPLVSWYLDHNLKTWSVSHPQFYTPLYLKRPIVFELEHYRMVKNAGNWLGKNGSEVIPKYGYSGSEIMKKAIETMHATYIGFHGYAEQWLADNPDLTNELANRCGYWYFPVRASYPSIITKNSAKLSIEWLNKGVAPAYNTFGLLLRFEAKDKSKSFDLMPVNSGNVNWLPDVKKTENYLIEIPSGAKNGIFTLKYKLIELVGEEQQPIQIGLSESAIDQSGFAVMGKIELDL